MTRNETLIWVHLYDGRDGFFGSLAAIYGVFKHEDIGISLDGLYNTVLPYGNKYCFIRRISVHRKPQKRN